MKILLVFFMLALLLFSKPNLINAACKYPYTVKRGDTLNSLIFKYFYLEPAKFKQLNSGVQRIKAGQVICLPKLKVTTPCTDCSNTENPSSKGFSTGLALDLTMKTRNLNKFSRFTSLGFSFADGLPKWNYKSEVDWRKSGKVQKIENQGSCAACWAFSATSALTSAYAISSGVSASDVDLSEQQLIDCMSAKCNGGWPQDALEYITQNKDGIYTQSTYPYWGAPKTCKNVRRQSVLANPSFKVVMYEQVNFQGSLGLLLAVQQQPVIVNLNGGWSSFITYLGDVYQDPSCSPYTIDHTVLVVGFNLLNSTPYWILKNSWGETWGINGYMHMAITAGLGICGIHATPGIYPVVAAKNPCGKINPCGSGKCSVNSQTGSNTCECPQTFLVVKNLDGSQSCAPVELCTFFISNPCGLGTCINDQKGGFTCICPPNYKIGQYADGTTTCVPNPLSLPTANTYTVQSKDTCYLIASQFGLKLSEFKKQNKDINCRPLTAGTIVNVTPTRGFTGCSVSYAVNNGETCTIVANHFGMSLATFKGLNPGVDCFNLYPGQQVCVAQGASTGLPLCTSYAAVFPGDTCESLESAYGLTPVEFFRINPGIYCDNLVSSVNTYQIPTYQVCVSAAAPAVCACKTKKYYTVRLGDTCSRILYNYYQGSITKFKSLNCNAPCMSKLVVGRKYCL